MVVFTAAVGVIGGVAYLWIRRWLPAKGQAVITGVAAAVVGGALVIETGGLEFSLLEPLWLAVALVVVLPGLYGFALSWSVERLLADRSVLHRLGGWGAAPVVLLVLGGLLAVVFGDLPGGPLAGVMVVIGAGWWVVRRYPRLKRWWRSEPITWAGRVALATAIVFAAVQLVRVQDLDLRDFTEALFLGDGPLSVGPPSDFMGGFPFGSQITVRFLNTVDPEWREAVRDLTGGCDEKTFLGGLLGDEAIPCAMGLTFTYSETSDRMRMEDAIQGGLRPPKNEVWVYNRCTGDVPTHHDHPRDHPGRDTFTYKYFEAGSPVTWAAIICLPSSTDQYEATHEMGHALGFQDLVRVLDISSYMMRPDSYHCSLSRYEFAAVQLTYAAGLRPGDTRQDFINAGLIEP